MVEKETFEGHEQIQRYSISIALISAMIMYGIGTLLAVDTVFNTTVAAFFAIGVRMYLPYQAGISSRFSVTTPSQTDEIKGDYNYGAVGGSLILGSIVALGIVVVQPGFYVPLAAGAVVTALSYLVLVSILPKD